MSRRSAIFIVLIMAGVVYLVGHMDQPEPKPAPIVTAPATPAPDPIVAPTIRACMAKALDMVKHMRFGLCMAHESFEVVANCDDIGKPECWRRKQ
jgi:hypothetical protein